MNRSETRQRRAECVVPALTTPCTISTVERDSDWNRTAGHVRGKAPVTNGSRELPVQTAGGRPATSLRQLQHSLDGLLRSANNDRPHRGHRL